MEKIQDALGLMVTGMGTVIFFLLLLVGVMTVMGDFFRRNSHWFPEDDPASPKAVAPSQSLAKIATAIAVAEHARRG